MEGDLKDSMRTGALMIYMATRGYSAKPIDAGMAKHTARGSSRSRNSAAINNCASGVVNCSDYRFSDPNSQFPIWTGLVIL